MELVAQEHLNKTYLGETDEYLELPLVMKRL